MNKKIILGIIVGIILGSVGGVYAGSNFYANGISVNAPTGSSLGSDATLDDAINELYSIADKYDELNKKINTLENNTLPLDKMYPVGSIYLSTTNINPGTYLGGTWENYGSSDTYLRLGGSGSGGSNSVTLQANQIPTHTTGNQSANHTHSIPALSGTAASAGAHSHTIQQYVWANTDQNGKTYTAFNSPDNIGAYYRDIKPTTNKTGAHIHSVTTKAGTTGANSANHTHTYTNSNQQSVSITPKYVQVYAFKRTA